MVKMTPGQQTKGGERPQNAIDTRSGKKPVSEQSLALYQKCFSPFSESRKHLHDVKLEMVEACHKMNV